MKKFCFSVVLLIVIIFISVSPFASEVIWNMDEFRNMKLADKYTCKRGDTITWEYMSW